MSKKQNFIFVSSAVVAIVVSVFATLYFSGYLDLEFGNKKQAYQNITFTDASITCKSESRDQFDKQRLKNLLIDNHSSRYDQASFSYKIFLQADTTSKKGKTVLHYINCFVSASNGKITKFEIYENKDAPKSSTTSGAKNLFNWPR